MTQQTFSVVLMKEQQHSQDVKQYDLTITEEQQHTLVARARKGDAQAYEAIILSFIPRCESLAARYTRTYAWASPRIEYEDLVQVGNLTVVTILPKALKATDPYPYLHAAVQHAISEHCRKHASLVTTPHWYGAKLPHFQVLSLEQPRVYHDQEHPLSLADHLPAASAPPTPERDYTSLYQAVDALSPRQRETVTRRYGLGCVPETAAAISASFGKAGSKEPTSAKGYERRALAMLRRKLGDASAQRWTGGTA